MKFMPLPPIEERRKMRFRELWCFTDLAPQYNASSICSLDDTSPSKRWKTALKEYFSSKWNIVSALLVQIVSPKGRLLDTHVLDEPPRVGKIRQLQHSRGGDDPGPNHREMFLPYLEAEPPPTRWSGSRKDDQNPMKCRYGFTVIPSQLHKSQFRHCELNGGCFTAYGQKEPLHCNGYFNARIKASDKTINTNWFT